MIVPASYAWTSPYVNADPRRVVGPDFQCVYGEWIWNAAGFRQRLDTVKERPEFFLLGNFSHDRVALKAMCVEEGINHAHWEDGFFPHYETQHLDPLGFCWESTLPRMTFCACSDRQRQQAQAARESWLERLVGTLPPGVRPPFVLWPLQLIGDQVNRCDMDLRDWCGLIRDFRRRLPGEFQLVLKEHPLAMDVDAKGLAELVEELPDIVIAPRQSNLTALIRESHAVAGVNSSVLYEARLMHHRPVYAYGSSWFTNHPDLFQPLAIGATVDLPHLDWVENPKNIRTEHLDEYANWFLAQLLARQIDCRERRSPEDLRRAIWRLSFQAHQLHGEAIFEN